MRWFLLAVFGGIIGWLCVLGGPDPRRWPKAAQRELGRMKAAAEEAVEAGKTAASTYEERMERDLAAAAGRPESV